MKNSTLNSLKIILFSLILSLLLYYSPQLIYFIEHPQDLISKFENSNPLILISLLALAIFTPLPSTPIAILSGALYGPYLGTVYSTIGVTIGALIAFFLSRFFLGEVAEKYLKNNKIYQKIIAEKQENLFKLVLFSRMIPQLHFGIVSYSAGLTKIKTWKFTVATFIGSIPIVFLLSYFGYVLVDYLLHILLFLLITSIIYIIIKKIRNKK